MKRPRILIFPGSNRSGSWNAKLAGTLTKAFAALECDPTRITLRDYPMPILDQDLESQKGPPENAVKLARMFHEHDGIVIVSPEYNASVTPLTKNTVDWISRVRSDQHGGLSPYRNKVFGLASASPGRFAGVRALFHLRATIANVGALVISEQVSIAFADKAFDAQDGLADEANRRHLDAFCRAMVETTNLLMARA